MTSFPLLRIPFLAQIVILRRLTPLDLFFLSQTSKKAKKLVKHSHMKELGLRLIIDDGEFKYGQLTINQDLIYYNISVYPFEMLGDDEEVELQENNYGFYYRIKCDDVPEKMKALMNYFHEVFGMKLLTVTLTSLPTQTVKSITDMIISQQSDIRDLKLEATKGPELDVAELLEKVKTTFKLCIHAKLKSGFRFIFHDVPKVVAFSEASWFTRQHLLTSEWVKLFVKGALITNEGINDFVNKWIEGNLPKLKFIAVESWKFHIKTQIAGRLPPIINPDLLPSNVKRIDEWRLNLDVNRGITIRNANGDTAKLTFDGPFFFLYVSD